MREGRRKVEGEAIHEKEAGPEEGRREDEGVCMRREEKGRGGRRVQSG